MKYLIVDNSNSMTINTLADTKEQAITIIDGDRGIDIKNIQVFEIAREVKLKKQPSIVIETE